MYAVILAGGGGTRLWPLSTSARPKPFLPLLGERTLLQLTADRLDGLVAPADVFVVTDRRYGALVRAQLPAATVLEEPVGRNTAAAVALALAAIDRPQDEVMAVLPADHLIGDEPLFHAVLRAAATLAEGACGVDDPIVTLGIEPTSAATGYGYLRPDLDSHRLTEGSHAYRLAAFIEKPSPGDAEALLRETGVTWNAGIFVARRGALRGAFAAHAPATLEAIEGARTSIALEAAYHTVAATSIDYAVMEPAARAGGVVMVGMGVPWSDLGSWDALLSALGAPMVRGSVIAAGDTASLGAGDLGLRRSGGHLALVVGPGTMVAELGPCALLVGAAAHRGVVEALLGRVATAEG
ncbi:MAG: mannose-1-phosphate guanylyltransferase [Candidatus Limnocylindrales bacterium]